MELPPELPGKELSGDDEAWQRLYRWLQDGRYLLREGTALTTELLLALPPGGADRSATAPLFDWLESPVAARPGLAYANENGALPRLAAKDGSPQPRYERFPADALRPFHEDRERWRAFGHLNFADWYGEGDWSWGNNEYDTPYCAYWEFLRRRPALGRVGSRSTCPPTWAATRRPTSAARFPAREASPRTCGPRARCCTSC